MPDTDKILQVFREARADGQKRPVRKPGELVTIEQRLHELFPIFFASIDAINGEISRAQHHVRFNLRPRDRKVANSPYPGQIIAHTDGGRFQLKVLTRGVGLLLEAPNAKPELFSPENDVKAAEFLARRLGQFYGPKSEGE